MNKTLRTIARLLAYPDESCRAALPEMATAVKEEGQLAPALATALATFLDENARRPLTEWQEEYVSLFDRGRRFSLHLFEHVHGESRDRGQAMVDLMNHYQSRGYWLDARELPDYIPLFLEFLSTQDDAEIAGMLADAMPVLVLLGARLAEKESPYRVLLDVLEAIGGSCTEATALRREASAEGPDETLEKMDEIWEEEQVTFLGNADPAGGGCASPKRPSAAAATPIRWLDKNPVRAAGHPHR